MITDHWLDAHDDHWSDPQRKILFWKQWNTWDKAKGVAFVESEPNTAELEECSVVSIILRALWGLVSQMSIIIRATILIRRATWGLVSKMSHGTITAIILTDIINKQWTPKPPPRDQLWEDWEAKFQNVTNFCLACVSCGSDDVVF